MSWKEERESPMDPVDPADSLNLRKSGIWVIKQTSQGMGVWSLLNGTDTIAPPGDEERPASCFPSRGILGRCGNWQATGWYIWAALWFPFLLSQLFPGRLQDVSPQSLFLSGQSEWGVSLETSKEHLSAGENCSGDARNGEFPSELELDWSNWPGGRRLELWSRWQQRHEGISYPTRFQSPEGVPMSCSTHIPKCSSDVSATWLSPCKSRAVSSQ